MTKEDLDLAKQHVELAEQIISEEARKKDLDEKKEKEFSEAQFALEKAEAEIEDLENL
jgi:hypothetical protein